ncbi:hypothetical protein DV737_g730, partial [Chaetothyriales sp. CBS 132003]
MVGMEELEIHSQSYLVRWVNAKADHTISWTIQPHKKSLQFGIFKHPGHAPGLQPPSSSTVVEDDGKPENGPNAPSIVEKLRSTGLRQVLWIGRCEADKVTHGRYDVPPGESGNYALVFDNTFSQHFSKTATVFLLTFPTAVQAHVQFGAQLHHSQVTAGATTGAMAGAMAIAASGQGSTAGASGGGSPRQRPFAKASADSLRKTSNPSLNAAALVDNAAAADEPSTIHTGVLSKRGRKKGRGYLRRFFCLDYATSTLSYYHNRNSSALHGAIPLSLAAIGANTKSREISIDSGAEIWHLRAPNQAEFDKWKAALEKASQLVVEPTTPANGLARAAAVDGAIESSSFHERDWARLETLLSRLSGIRDAVRRLSLETLATSDLNLASRSGVATPTEDLFEESLSSDQRPKAFWKRKASANNTQTATLKRITSSQLSAPVSGGTNSAVRDVSGSYNTPTSRQHRENGLHDHCAAMLHDIDAVVAEFNAILTGNKIRRNVAPVSAVSRLSTLSVDSQEYFDAEDEQATKLLDIHSDDEKDDNVEEADDVAADDDSEASSDMDDDEPPSAVPPGQDSLSSFLPPKAKSLQPLPLQSVHRRVTVPAPTITPPSLIGFLRKNVGKDLSTIAMPVSANEPTSLLQRSAEALEYSELLDQAAQSTDGQEQLLLVTAFALSSLSNARVKERSIRKPFNPMLGETYELVREDKGFRFVSEKVSHRPVQLAFHAESSDWAFTQSPQPLQKFWGKSSEIITDGKARLVFFGSGHSYSWVVPTCFLRNIIAGEKYIEPVGTMTVFNETDGSKAVATFKAKGMFSGRSEELEVELFDQHGTPSGLGLDGTWTQSLQRKENGAVTKKAVWAAGPLVQQAPKHYGMTLFAASLNEITEVEQDHLAPTDSRLRLDQQALERGDHDKAEELKNALEEAQRSRRKEMEVSGETWNPRWFTKVEQGDEVVWKLKTGKDGYWEERSKGHQIERRHEAQTDAGVTICPFTVDLLQDSQGQDQVFGYGAWSVVLKGSSRAGAVLESSHSSGALTRPLSPTNSLPLVVAVKRPARIDAIPILENEGKILTYLSHIKDYSKHVVTFYGVAVPDQTDLVLEVLPFSLEEYIKRCAAVAKRTLTTWNMSEPVVGSPGVWLSLAESVISGLVWLHEVAGVNDEDKCSFAFQPLFIDFSSSHRVDARVPRPLNTLSAVTREYTAPELLVSSVLREPSATATKQSDVFSLAVTLLVAATGNTMVYLGSVFQRQAMATRGWQVLDFVRSSSGSIEDGGARVPRHGVVDRALTKAVVKADHGHGLDARISAREWLLHVQQMRRGELTKTLDL